jgi:hypothetical protein
MEKFTSEETARLNELLSVEINPYLNGTREIVGLPLGKTTQDWLFSTYMNLPMDAQEELHALQTGDMTNEDKIQLLNDVLEARQASSAPLWWELNFFEVKVGDLWDYFVDQARSNYSKSGPLEYFDRLEHEKVELDEARLIIMVSAVNKTKYPDETVASAMETVDRAYPLDFRDYEEVPQIPRSPTDRIRELIGSELSDLETIFSKRWFEFKILDELAGYISYGHESVRKSDLSQKIAAQLRSYMFGQTLALGRMIEHYRWKFSYEADALRGIQSAQANKARGSKGGKASEQAKRRNLECLMKELEVLGDMYPRMSEDAIFQQAYFNAASRTKMPKSPKSIVDYGATLRSDEPYKSRTTRRRIHLHAGTVRQTCG